MIVRWCNLSNLGYTSHLKVTEPVRVSLSPSPSFPWGPSTRIHGMDLWRKCWGSMPYQSIQKVLVKLNFFIYLYTKAEIPHFILLHFIALSKLAFLISRSFVVTLCWASLLEALFQQHLLTSCLCHVLENLEIFQIFFIIVFVMVICDQ